MRWVVRESDFARSPAVGFQPRSGRNPCLGGSGLTNHADSCILMHVSECTVRRNP
ncbi:predicted protein [Streptomyces viridosporus ATCC 14672]|uniref:Predicted protein n=1 Tax=Streptomyces viridosporus (strain ATCC 14672 / DSM 40746 / JCM 4963 / KCTC 9882 / NRRL B-12104 / FH 1290) TaxID=566461 RepID=D5ZSF2_STRV1|nr:predicted protein [Streptomyces viridosporus ATCC 14672]